MLAMLVVVTSMDSVAASRDCTETLRSAVSPHGQPLKCTEARLGNGWPPA